MPFFPSICHKQNYRIFKKFKTVEIVWRQYMIVYLKYVLKNLNKMFHNNLASILVNK